MVKTRTILRIGAFSILASFGFSASAQISVDVATNSFNFTPANITIDQGDTVRWTNFSGTHNVNGFTSTFASNPESFGNPADGSGTWVYEFVFNIAGTYAYQCGIHGASMPGTIIVNSVAGIEALDSDSKLRVFPNPTSGEATITATSGIGQIRIHSEDGRLISTEQGNSSTTYALGVNDYVPGVYFISAELDGQGTMRAKLIVR